jgi:hypothetical protein
MPRFWHGKFNGWAPPLFGRAWIKAPLTWIGGQYKIEFDTISDAPSAMITEVYYWNGAQFVTDTFTGPGEATFNVGDRISQPKFRFSSTSLG